MLNNKEKNLDIFDEGDVSLVKYHYDTGLLTHNKMSNKALILDDRDDVWRRSSGDANLIKIEPYTFFEVRSHISMY